MWHICSYCSELFTATGVIVKGPCVIEVIWGCGQNVSLPNHNKTQQSTDTASIINKTYYVCAEDHNTNVFNTWNSLGFNLEQDVELNTRKEC